MAVEHPHGVQVLQDHQHKLERHQPQANDDEHQLVQLPNGRARKAHEESQAAEAAIYHPWELAAHVPVVPVGRHLCAPGNQDA
eukprot:CAMPEP_0174348154 /NCGR_PEP_ID=MMETSP0811_2-20130205/4516_1 /TAXON_ID=73025 ORGANISM="Eutreptiella gymnastica-like, Strain CCMP1594" /NCGR_SAMPLE_ID=MMETSP0811_2 /ASSEMBLY_ACC=CAM_ASM_000667 /LENGTH=82 /DNA_ID=CAMNT_0015474435 /DNA_START=2927 /DNA_END=3175 /DNA_ORIENTATION=+